MGNFIYKYVLNDEIIYIGKTKCLDSRIYQHSIEEKFKPYLKESVIFYFECANSVEMDLIERALINQYKPELNVTDKKDGYSALISVQEPAWKKWKKNCKKRKPPKIDDMETRAQKSRKVIGKSLRYRSRNGLKQENVFYKNQEAMFAFYQIIFDIQAKQYEAKNGLYHLPCYVSGWDVYDIQPEIVSDNGKCIARLPIEIINIKDYPLPYYAVPESFLDDIETEWFMKCLKKSNVWKLGGEWEYSNMQEAVKRCLEAGTGEVINYNRTG